MPDTLQGWAAQLATLPAALVRATPAAVGTGAGILEDQARANLRTASGGDGLLSRVRSGKGARVDVRVQVTGAGSRAAAAVLPVGPVSLLEGNTRPHAQPFGYSGTSGAGGRRRYATAGQVMADGGTARRGRATRRGLIYVPGLGMFQHVRHPGTTGKHPVANAFGTAHEAAGQAGLAVFTEAVHQHMSD